MLPTIDDPVTFLETHGLLFEFNRQVLHPLGMELRMERGESGAASLELLDNRDNAELLGFSPEAFDEGRKRYEAYLADRGRRNIQKRRHAGMVIQTGPNVRFPFITEPQAAGTPSDGGGDA